MMIRKDYGQHTFFFNNNNIKKKKKDFGHKLCTLELQILSNVILILLS